MCSGSSFRPKTLRVLTLCLSLAWAQYRSYERLRSVVHIILDAYPAITYKQFLCGPGK